MAAGDPPRCVLLSPQSREYQDVETEITSTSNRIQVKQVRVTVLYIMHCSTAQQLIQNVYTRPCRSEILNQDSTFFVN